MKSKLVCNTCSEKKRCQNSKNAWVFFMIGLIGTVAIRLVAILIHYNSLYAKISWYLGVGGISLFFVYKYSLSKFRRDIIIKKDLVNKILSNDVILEEDRLVVGKILCILSSDKERLSFLFIFILSLIAVFVALYLDVLR
jgi:hypothetical protein